MCEVGVGALSVMDRWTNRVALVTGASVGIGAEIVEKLVKSGLKVVGVARRTELVEELAEKLKNEKGKLYAIKGDVSKEEDIVAAFQWVDTNLGELSILINNAGVYKSSKVTDFELDKWHDIYNLNVFGLGICTREALKLMKKYKIDGHVININSIAGHRFPLVPESLVYSMSKHNVTNLTKCLHRELKESNTNIKITSLSPGLVKTDMTTTLLKNHSDIPTLNAEDIANAALYVLSAPQHVHITELTIMPTGAL